MMYLSLGVLPPVHDDQGRKSRIARPETETGLSLYSSISHASLIESPKTDAMEPA